mgnify:CR=1 FL=1
MHEIDGRTNTHDDANILLPCCLPSFRTNELTVLKVNLALALLSFQSLQANAGEFLLF